MTARTLRERNVTLAVITAAVLTVAVAYVAVARQSPEPEVLRGHGQVMFDTRDPREIAERSDNVFVGRVVGESARQARRPVAEGDDRLLPETQYDVEVVQALKGSLAGRIVVNATFMDRDDGTTALTTGGEYLFATRSSDRWESAGHAYRHVRLPTSDAERVALLDEWASAVGSPIDG